MALFARKKRKVSSKVAAERRDGAHRLEDAAILFLLSEISLFLRNSSDSGSD